MSDFLGCIAVLFLVPLVIILLITYPLPAIAFCLALLALKAILS